MDDNILHGSGGAKDPTTKSTRTDAPLLQSLAANRAAARLELEYRDLLIGWANEMAFMAVSEGDTPTYEQARAGPEWRMWEDAMQKELEGLHKAGTIDEPPVRARRFTSVMESPPQTRS
eukprot:scaffold10583_cov118-Isochrysis_galbana.AAC.5